MIELIDWTAPEKHLLNKDALQRLQWALRDTTENFKQIQGFYDVLAKYKNKVWFIKMMANCGKTEADLEADFYERAKKLTRLEASIEEYKLKLQCHYHAQEILYRSNKPYTGLNLSQHQFIQQQLF